MAGVNEETLIEKYEGADAIYALSRKKKHSKLTHAFDFAIAFFTPLAGVSDEVDYFDDMGKYFLVEKDGEKILVRVSGEEITEEVITGKAKKKRKNVFVYNNNQFAVSKDILAGKAVFTINF